MQQKKKRKNLPTRLNPDKRADRISMITEMLIQGARKSEINSFLAQNYTWHPRNPAPDKERVVKRTIDNYFAEAKELIIKTADKKREYHLAMAIEQLDNLYNKSYNIQDYKNCRQIVHDRNELLGLLRIESHHTKMTQTIDLTKFSFKEIKELLHGKEEKTDQPTIDITHEELPTPEQVKK